MLTFVEFYASLMGFLNFKLFTSLNLKYPPQVRQHIATETTSLLCCCCCCCCCRLKGCLLLLKPQPSHRRLWTPILWKVERWRITQRWVECGGCHGFSVVLSSCSCWHPLGKVWPGSSQKVRPDLLLIFLRRLIFENCFSPTQTLRKTLALTSLWIMLQ